MTGRFLHPRPSLFLVAAVIALGCLDANAQRFPDYGKNNEWNPTDGEVMMLPDYCRRQFRPPPAVPGARKPKRSGPRVCPVNMNHFCPGLVALNRAKNPAGSRSQRKFILGVAEQQIMQVHDNMPPACPRARDVATAARQVRMMQMLLK